MFLERADCASLIPGRCSLTLTERRSNIAKIDTSFNSRTAYSRARGLKLADPCCIRPHFVVLESGDVLTLLCTNGPNRQGHGGVGY